MLTTSLA